MGITDFENIVVSSTNSPEKLISCRGTVNISPLILNDLTYIFGQGPSAEKTFTVSGVNLIDNITILPPLNYEISTSSGNLFSPVDPIILSPTLGVVGKTIIYARLKVNLTVQQYNEKVQLSSNQATSKFVSIIGKVDSIGTALINPLDNELIVTVLNGAIKIHNLESGKQIDIFNAIAQKTKSIQSTSGDNYIMLPHGIHIIRIGTQVKKIIL